MREIRQNGRPRWLGLALLLGAALVLWPGANARADDSALAAVWGDTAIWGDTILTQGD